MHVPSVVSGGHGAGLLIGVGVGPLHDPTLRVVPASHTTGGGRGHRRQITTQHRCVVIFEQQEQLSKEES